MPRTQLSDAQRQERRVRILEAALAEFSANGFHRAEVAAIACRAKVAKGTVYNYFSSKKEIFAGVIEMGINVLCESLDRIANEKRPALVRLKRAVLEQLRFAEEHFVFYTIMIKEAIRAVPEAIDNCEKCHHLLLDQVERIVKDCIKEGAIIRTDSYQLALFLHGLVDAVTMDAVMEGDKSKVQKGYRYMMRMFLDGVRKR